MKAPSCQACGKPIERLQTSCVMRFCSKKCWSGHKVDKVCRQCGESYRGKPDSLYCGSRCGKRAYYDRRYRKSNTVFRLPDYTGENVDAPDGGTMRWDGRPSLGRPL